jgi:hypothetical protein
MSLSGDPLSVDPLIFVNNFPGCDNAVSVKICLDSLLGRRGVRIYFCNCRHGFLFNTVAKLRRLVRAVDLQKVM